MGWKWIVRVKDDNSDTSPADSSQNVRKHELTIVQKQDLCATIDGSPVKFLVVLPCCGLPNSVAGDGNAVRISIPERPTESAAFCSNVETNHLPVEGLKRSLPGRPKSIVRKLPGQAKLGDH
jgi:hypothetical protein